MLSVPGAVAGNGPDAPVAAHYGQPTAEQRALEAGTAVVDLSHRGVVTVSGPDRLTWLHALTTQHHEQLQPGQWQEALILDPQGHVEYQFLVVDDGDTVFLVLDPGYKQSLIEYLNKMKFMLRVDVRDATSEFAVLRAPGAMTDLGGPYALVPRAELNEMRRVFSENATQVGTWALDAMRVAAGRVRIGFETDHKSIPNELVVLNKSVHMAKGCYRGQETVAKIYNLGNPPRRLVLLHLDGSVVTSPAQGTDVKNGEVKVGFLGTVARHHELGTIALAVIKRNTPVDAELSVDGIPAIQQIIVPA